MVLLTVPKESSGEKRPQLLIVEPQDEDYTEVSTDLLSVRGFENYRACDYHLEYLLEDQVLIFKYLKLIVLGELENSNNIIALCR